MILLVAWWGWILGGSCRERRCTNAADPCPGELPALALLITFPEGPRIPSGDGASSPCFSQSKWKSLIASPN